jgi:hypothetical protein
MLYGIEFQVYILILLFDYDKDFSRGGIDAHFGFFSSSPPSPCPAVLQNKPKRDDESSQDKTKQTVPVSIVFIIIIIMARWITNQHISLSFFSRSSSSLCYSFVQFDTKGMEVPFMSRRIKDHPT